MPFDATPQRQPRNKKLRYAVDLACNDPDTGNEVGLVRAVYICDGALESTDRIFDRPLRLVELDDAIRLAGKKWPVTWSKYGVGNWCWNGYGMKAEGVIAFCLWLRRRKLFWNWEGCCDLVDWMEGEREMSPFELRTQLDAWLMTE